MIQEEMYGACCSTILLMSPPNEEQYLAGIYILTYFYIENNSFKVVSQYVM